MKKPYIYIILIFLSISFYLIQKKEVSLLKHTTKTIENWKGDGLGFFLNQTKKQFKAKNLKIHWTKNFKKTCKNYLSKNFDKCINIKNNNFNIFLIYKQNKHFKTKKLSIILFLTSILLIVSVYFILIKTNKINNNKKEYNKESKSKELINILSSIRTGIIIVDQDSNIKAINKRAEEIFHIKKKATNKNTIEFIKNVSLQRCIDKVLIGYKDKITKEISLEYPEHKILLINITPTVERSIIKGAILSLEDITNFKKTEQIRKDFVANVSHELKTPIASIRGFSETLLNGNVKEEKDKKEFLKIINEESQKLDFILNDLLDLSKLESSNKKLEIKKYNLKRIVNKVLKSLSNHPKISKFKINNNIDEKTEIKTDKQRLSQVFLNLIDNSIKYTDKDEGIININAKELKNKINITIEDNGIGIPKDKIPRIFERFYRVDKAHSRKIHGTGLGLAIVKHIISSLKGKIEVESKINIGTKFILSFKDYS
jgi:two-component system, OmpR family, phosphate regulon sensor histidine kinase PhoR